MKKEYNKRYFEVRIMSLADNGITEEGFIRKENETILISHNPKMLISKMAHRIMIAQQVMPYEEAYFYCKKRLGGFVTEFNEGDRTEKKSIWRKIKELF